MKHDKQYQALLELYVEVYKHLGLDFNSLEKEEGFYKNYEIDAVEETKIVNRVLNSKRLTKHQKIQVRNSYYLGVSPQHKKI